MPLVLTRVSALSWGAGSPTSDQRAGLFLFPMFRLRVAFWVLMLGHTHHQDINRGADKTQVRKGGHQLSLVDFSLLISVPLS